jgi:NitT/TauT family transport system permease protein
MQNVIKWLSLFYHKNFKIKIFQFLIFLVIIALWELGGQSGIINAFLFSSPSRIYLCFIESIKSNILLDHLVTSTFEVFIALIISTLSALVLSLIIYLSPTLNKIINPFLMIINAIPKSATGIIFIIWFGASLKGICAVSISFSIIISLISLINYYQNIDEELIKIIKILGGNKIQLITKIILPSSIKNIFSLIKINIGLSWVGVIVGEFLVSQKGIGYLILYGGQVFKMDLVMMGIILLVIIALLMNVVVDLIYLAIKKIIYHH